MIVNVIGWVSLLWAAIAFIAAWLNAYHHNYERSITNEYQSIGYLLIAVICFK